MMEFLEMGGYARYLWPSFGLFIGLLLWQGIGAVRQHRHALQTLRAKAVSA